MCLCVLNGNELMLCTLRKAGTVTAHDLTSTTGMHAAGPQVIYEDQRGLKGDGVAYRENTDCGMIRNRCL